MLTRGKLFLAAAALLMALPGVAKADGFRSYRVCGGDTFTTCAAVRITVLGNNVTVDVWNLSGNTAATYGTQSNAGSIFNGIGFYHVPAGIDVVTGSMSVTGPTKRTAAQPKPVAHEEQRVGGLRRGLQARYGQRAERRNQEWLRLVESNAKYRPPSLRESMLQ
jgi:hypothetical protein